MRVFLIHLQQPYQVGNRKPCRHYAGWTRDDETIEEKLARETRSRFLKVIEKAGIGMDVVRVWEGADMDTFRKLKDGHAARHCPVCRGGSAA